MKQTNKNQLENAKNIDAVRKTLDDEQLEQVAGGYRKYHVPLPYIRPEPPHFTTEPPE